MLKSKIWFFGFITCIAINMNAEAKLFKWVDDNGVTHYGEIIPPEYANKDRDALKKSGMLEKRPEKVDPAALRAKEEADQKLKIEKQAAVEQQRRDNTLLNTYSNEKEIDMARDRSLSLIQARVESNKMLINSAQGTLEGLKKESDQRTKEGKKIPVSLTNDISKTEARIEKYNAEMSKNGEELNAIKTRFEHEKELYRKLKGIPATK